MSSIISLLFSGSRSAPAVEIPTYVQGNGEDSIDLQIKSLTYIFRRCEVANSKPFLDSSSCVNQADHAFLNDISASDQQKLDHMYNKIGFEQLLLKDEHRILIDWPKNKFRSLCILSEGPSDLDRLPPLGDDKQSFHFSILSPTSLDDEYIRALSESTIYMEHSVPNDTRRRLAKEAVERYPAFELSEDAFDRYRTKDDRANIINAYLASLAIEVQVQRLYRGSLRFKQEQMKKNRSRSPSPVVSSNSTPSSRAASPERKLFVAQNGSPNRNGRSPERSMRPASPTKTTQFVNSSPVLKAKRSNATLRSQMSPKTDARATSPQTSPKRILRQSNSHTTLNQIPKLSPAIRSSHAENLSQEVPIEVQRELLTQARVAVKNRIIRERGIIAHTYDPKLITGH